ncbi:hypothetical protein [Vitiosangium sp. GDMCC 1.1324]|uniref:hypothetical protein n=1 Tax=Vitiosangium sp. (strain GDMCC 1.1324) TaxID=2138576 RepID=UPI000D362A38|nr:hypothetical protein [Vitiosangium sp. GDMCC 1.1324]PTL79618.1 hypothetical protein DAT35_32940 [Vitiosangium sp. GDMCC 1.1324]
MSEQKRLKKPVEKLRAELLEDSDTKRIAKAVGMELEAYVELVLDYVQNPDKQPVLQVASDEELRAAGYEPPSAEDVGNFFLAGARGELGIGGPDFSKSGFEGAKASAGKPSLQGTEGQQQVRSGDSETSQELLNQVRKGGSGRI